MATIKHTKNELKLQRDALRRYERFLPMLQLKKHQLLAEIQSLDVQIAECARRQEQLRAGASAWLPLLNEEPDFSRYLHIAELQFRDGNIAGVTVQWCFITESLNKSVQKKGPHGYGSLVRASGGVSLETVRAIAETGVDLISVGALTHSYKSVDISMLFA